MDVDAVRRSRYFPVSNQSLIIGKERAFALDHLFNEHTCLGVARRSRETSNLIEMRMIMEHIREDHGVPDCEGYLQRFSRPVFRRLAREVMNYGLCEVQERLGDFSIRKPRCSVFGHLSPSMPELLF